MGAGDTGSTPVLNGLASQFGTAEENGAGTGGASEGELIEGDDLAAGLQDAGTDSAGEAQGAHGELGDGEETGVIGDGTDDDGNLVLLALHVTGQAGDGESRAVDLAHEQSLQHNSVELGVGAASQEAVQLFRKTAIIRLQTEIGGLVITSLF